MEQTPKNQPKNYSPTSATLDSEISAKDGINGESADNINPGVDANHSGDAHINARDSEDINAPDSARDRATYKVLVKRKVKGGVGENVANSAVVSLLPFPVSILSPVNGFDINAARHVIPVGQDISLSVRSSTTHVDNEFGIRVAYTREICPDLPEPVEGILYLVSGRVRRALPHRLDLISPGLIVKNGHGEIVGCLQLEMNAPTLISEDLQ